MNAFFILRSVAMGVIFAIKWRHLTGRRQQVKLFFTAGISTMFSRPDGVFPE